MKQVEIFSRTDVAKLQYQINEFLKQLSEAGKECLDIKFSSTETDEQEPVYAALVIFEE